jgi:hypothetical protein
MDKFLHVLVDANHSSYSNIFKKNIIYFVMIYFISKENQNMTNNFVYLN